MSPTRTTATASLLATALVLSACGAADEAPDAIATTTESTAAELQNESAPVESLPSADESTTTVAPPTNPVEVPAGFVSTRSAAAGEGITFVLPERYSPLDLTRPLAEQGRSLGVDDAGMAALDGLSVSLSRGDFSYAAMEFNTGSDTTDNILVIRYDAAGAPTPTELADLYSNQTLNGGGEVRRAQATTIQGRDAVVLEISTPVDGVLLNDQFIAIVYGDTFLHEVVVTLRKPADDAARTGAFATLDSIQIAR